MEFIESSDGWLWSCGIIELMVELSLNSISKSNKPHLDLRAQKGHPLPIQT